MRLKRVLSGPVALLALSALSPILGLQTAEQIVQDANKLLAEGSYVEAARAYGDAIELEPTYSNYYKRATAYLSSGRTSAALDDFDTILQLNPSFIQAHFQKAKILAKQGDFEAAQAEIKVFLKFKQDPEVSELGSNLQTAMVESKAAYKSAASRRWQDCVDQATRALESATQSASLRKLRLECATELGDLDLAYGDMSRLSTLDPADPHLSLANAQISYFLLASSNANNYLKQCLHYDPDSKPCKKLRKTLRSLEKETAKVRNFVEGSSWRQAMKVLDGSDGLLAEFNSALSDAVKGEDGQPKIPPQFHPEERSQMRMELLQLACKTAVGLEDFSEKKGGRWCDELFTMDPEDVDALIGRGEKLLKQEQYDDALRTFNEAFEKGGRSNHDVHARLQKAQKLLKRSKQNDYYKVLEVPRDADAKTIKKSYKKMAKLNHPDKQGGNAEKMEKINQAYEVLGNEELRRRYDDGDDPNDPTGGQGGNPFAHHGGVPFQFFQQQGGFPNFQQGFASGGQKFHFKFGG